MGLYQVDRREVCPPGSLDPMLRHDISGFHRYAMHPLEALAEYQDKVVIDWGPGTRAWVQLARNQAKPVTEIAQQYEPPFPGFRSFVRPVDAISSLPDGWKQVLRSVKGVYVLVDRDSGHQYVGSAKGAESLLGRWASYAAGGDGGDVALRAAARQGLRHYQVSVLEVSNCQELWMGVS